MQILLSNVHHCSQMYIFWHLKKIKLQIFKNMPNLPQNAHFALKCTSLLSNVHFWTFLDIFLTLNFRKHAKFPAKSTFCSQNWNTKPPAAKLHIVYYQHINQNTLPLVAVTQNNTASVVKTLSNFKHQNLLNVVVLVIS